MLCLLCPPWSWRPVWAQQHPDLGSCLPRGLQGVQAGGGGKLVFSQLSGEGSPCVRLGGMSHIPARSAAILRTSLGPETSSGLRGHLLLSSFSFPEAPPPGLQCSRPEGAYPCLASAGSSMPERAPA